MNKVSKITGAKGQPKLFEAGALVAIIIGVVYMAAMMYVFSQIGVAK